MMGHAENKQEISNQAGSIKTPPHLCLGVHSVSMWEWLLTNNFLGGAGCHTGILGQPSRETVLCPSKGLAGHAMATIFLVKTVRLTLASLQLNGMKNSLQLY